MDVWMCGWMNGWIDVRMHVCIFLSVHLPVYLSVYFCPSIWLSICPNVCVPACLPTYTPCRRSICLPVQLYTFHLSLCFSAFLYIYLCSHLSTCFFVTGCDCRHAKLLCILPLWKELLWCTPPKSFHIIHVAVSTFYGDSQDDYKLFVMVCFALLCFLLLVLFCFVLFCVCFTWRTDCDVPC